MVNGITRRLHLARVSVIRNRNIEATCATDMNAAFGYAHVRFNPRMLSLLMTIEKGWCMCDCWRTPFLRFCVCVCVCECTT